MTQVIEVCNAVDTGCRQVIRKVRHAREAMRIEVVIARDISRGRTRDFEDEPEWARLVALQEEIKKEDA